MPTKLLNFPLLLLHLFSKDPGDHEKRIPWRTRSRNNNSTWTCEKQKCIITYINGYISLYTIFFEHAFKSLRTSTSLSLSVFHASIDPSSMRSLTQSLSRQLLSHLWSRLLAHILIDFFGGSQLALFTCLRTRLLIQLYSLLPENKCLT